MINNKDNDHNEKTIITKAVLIKSKLVMKYIGI